MYSIFYIIGVVVVVMAVLGYFHFASNPHCPSRRASPAPCEARP